MIIWTDVETTGLDPCEDELLEVALVVTDDQLVETAHMSVVCRPLGCTVDQCIAKCDDYVKNMHTKNGLFDDMRSGGVLTRAHEDSSTAEAMLISFLRQAFRNVPDVASHTCAECGKNEKDHLVGGTIPAKYICPPRQDGRASMFAPKMLSALSQTPLAGSTVGFDRGFLREHMPLLNALWHYRSIDVSALTELSKRWSPEVYKNRPKAEAGAAHRALADVRESVAYLKYFRDSGFVGGIHHATLGVTVGREDR